MVALIFCAPDFTCFLSLQIQLLRNHLSATFTSTAGTLLADTHIRLNTHSSTLYQAKPPLHWWFPASSSFHPGRAVISVFFSALSFFNHSYPAFNHSYWYIPIRYNVACLFCDLLMDTISCPPSGLLVIHLIVVSSDSSPFLLLLSSSLAVVLLATPVSLLADPQHFGCVQCRCLMCRPIMVFASRLAFPSNFSNSLLQFHCKFLFWIYRFENCSLSLF